MRKQITFAGVLIAVLMLGIAAAAAEGNTAAPGAAKLPITTKVARAGTLYEAGLSYWQDKQKNDSALEMWRHAIKFDPDFALGHMMIAYRSTSAGEQAAERERALATMASASAGEKLVIEWLAKAGEKEFVPAISAMNEALTMYPQDERLAWMAADWLTSQKQYERAIPLFERAHVAGSYDQLAYCYLVVGKSDKSLEVMRKYLESLPNEPNPQAAYAEMLRMAGKYGEAIEHYNAALKLDSHFAPAQGGVADTYALMGDQARARSEYDKAIKLSRNHADAVRWSIQSAITYVREGKFDEANTALHAAAKQAHEWDLGQFEAEAFRVMAVYQKDPNAAMDLVSAAQQALQDFKHYIPPALRDQEMEAVLRIRVARALELNNPKLADQTLIHMKDMATASGSPVMMSIYNGAAGTVLFSQNRYEEAIPLLEEDDANPLSLRMLALAYERIKDVRGATRVANTLSSVNQQTIEASMVVADFRAHRSELVPSSMAAGK